VEDWVGPDHPARFVREFVDGIEMKALGFEQPAEGVEGRPAYSPKLLLRAWIYGYLKKTRSSRKLEEACQEQMGFVWLCGGLRPDHNTLWRFWKANRLTLRKLFKQTVQVAAKLEMVGFVAQAVDGTKIQALCSSRRKCDEASLKRWLEDLDEQVEKQVEEHEAKLLESGQEVPFGPVNLPESLRDSSALREQVRGALEQVQAGEAKAINPKEPDARKGKKGFGYNAQAVVDDKSQILVASEVVQDLNDTQLLDPMLDLAERTGEKACETSLADGGYSSGEQLDRAQGKNREVIMPLPPSSRNPDDNPYHISKFVYDEQADEVVCPQQRRLPFKSNAINKGVNYRTYRSAAACRDCPVRCECTKSRSGREIGLSEWAPAIERQRRKMDTQAARIAYRRRAPLIESVFGWIKEVDGLRRWSFRGLESVRTQWAMLCSARNLWKIYAVWKRGKRRSAFPHSGSAPRAGRIFASKEPSIALFATPLRFLAA
jgi:transposase